MVSEYCVQQKYKIRTNNPNSRTTENSRFNEYLGMFPCALKTERKKSEYVRKLSCKDLLLL